MFPSAPVRINNYLAPFTTHLMDAFRHIVRINKDVKLYVRLTRAVMVFKTVLTEVNRERKRQCLPTASVSQPRS